MLPGPVSNAVTCSGAAPAGITVTLAMPPMLSATRVRRGVAEQQVVHERHQRRALPPAAMSRARKFETTGTPVRSASTAGSPICSVCRPPS